MAVIVFKDGKLFHIAVAETHELAFEEAIKTIHDYENENGESDGWIVKLLSEDVVEQIYNALEEKGLLRKE